MSLPDTIFIFALALVIFGPKKLPEIGRQIGKLVFEFRRASNEFKMQIEEELRAAEQADRQKMIAAETSAEFAPAVTAKEAMIARPPSTGVTVSAESPFSVVPVEEEAATLEAVSSATPVLAPAVESQENGHQQPIEHTLETASAPLPEVVTNPELPPPAIASPPTGAGANATASAETHSGTVPAYEEEATLEAASLANPVPDAGSRQDAARSAEEHIREQIAIHHG